MAFGFLSLRREGPSSQDWLVSLMLQGDFRIGPQLRGCGRIPTVPPLRARADELFIFRLVSFSRPRDCLIKHARARSLFPSCQLAIARGNKSKAVLVASFTDFSIASMAPPNSRRGTEPHPVPARCRDP